MPFNNETATGTERECGAIAASALVTVALFTVKKGRF